VKPGTEVRYWKGEKKGSPSGVATVYEVGDIGGLPVVWLEGVRGCIAVSHCEAVAQPAKTEVQRIGVVARKGQP
jgi:hypothetical protein